MYTILPVVKPMSVQVHFLPNQVTIAAEPGEPLLTVADRAGVTIPTGCLMGSCHACEVDLEAGADCESICACITAVPNGPTEITINLYADPTW